MYGLHEKAILFLPPETVEAEALQQIRNTASMGFIFKHVAVSAGRNNTRVQPTAAPHGAGRRYSRTRARKLFTMRDLDQAMTGIEYRRSNVLLDEIPSACKDIDEVMEHAKSLVEIRHTLKQFLNVKGD